MARFDMSGLEETIRDMQRMGQQSGNAAKAVLQAGAEKVKAAWRAATEAHGLVDTGDMLESIGFARNPKQIGDMLSIDIYPQGRDRKGVRNAEKAFILHYGTSRHPATRFIDDADAMSEAEAIPAMEEIWDQYIKTGTVPTVPLTPNHPGGVSAK
jgi:hypothetical protein